MDDRAKLEQRRAELRAKLEHFEQKVLRSRAQQQESERRLAEKALGIKREYDAIGERLQALDTAAAPPADGAA